LLGKRSKWSGLLPQLLEDFSFEEIKGCLATQNYVDHINLIKIMVETLGEPTTVDVSSYYIKGNHTNDFDIRSRVVIQMTYILHLHKKYKAISI